MINSKNNRTGLSLVVISLLFIFQQIANKIGSFIANSFNYKAIDEYGIFANVSVHHIVQMIIALLVIIILTKKYKIDFGFNVGDKKLGMRYVTVFSVALLIYAIIEYGIGYFSNQILQYDYPLNLKNVLGTLGFQLLLSGTSEEILFRALPIGIITFWIGSNKEMKIAKWNISYEVIVAAALFSIAHIRWTINPFSISMIYLQLIYSFVLGIIYGKVYQESNSVIYPMIMHSISNVIMVGLGYLFAIMRY